MPSPKLPNRNPWLGLTLKSYRAEFCYLKVLKSVDNPEPRDVIEHLPPPGGEAGVQLVHHLHHLLSKVELPGDQGWVGRGSVHRHQPLLNLDQHAVVGVENLTGDLEERLKFVRLVSRDFVQGASQLLQSDLKLFAREGLAAASTHPVT